MMIVNFRNGFTLLEVLIAIVITSLIGLGSWQLLNSAIRTNELTQVRLEELAQLQKSLFFVARDMQQISPRSVKDEFGDLQPAVSTRAEFYAMEMTRVGWRNPLAEQRSELQRVAYELDQEGTLRRHYWRVLDRAQDSEPLSRTLLEGVESFNLSFLNDSGAWVDEWPPEVSEEQSDPFKKYNVLPRALQVELEHPQFGNVVRLFDLVSYIEHIEIVSEDGSPNDGNNVDDDNANVEDEDASENEQDPTVSEDSQEEVRS